jgi:hypothetical protein
VGGLVGGLARADQGREGECVGLHLHLLHVAECLNDNKVKHLEAGLGLRRTYLESKVPLAPLLARGDEGGERHHVGGNAARPHRLVGRPRQPPLPGPPQVCG